MIASLDLEDVRLEWMVLEVLRGERGGLSIPELVARLLDRGIDPGDVFYVNGRPTSPSVCAALLRLGEACQVVFLPQTGKWYATGGGRR